MLQSGFVRELLIVTQTLISVLRARLRCSERAQPSVAKHSALMMVPRTAFLNPLREECYLAGSLSPMSHALAPTQAITGMSEQRQLHAAQSGRAVAWLSNGNAVSKSRNSDRAPSGFMSGELPLSENRCWLRASELRNANLLHESLISVARAIDSIWRCVPPRGVSLAVVVAGSSGPVHISAECRRVARGHDSSLAPGATELSSSGHSVARARSKKAALSVLRSSVGSCARSPEGAWVRMRSASEAGERHEESCTSANAMTRAARRRVPLSDTDAERSSDTHSRQPTSTLAAARKPTIEELSRKARSYVGPFTI